MSEFKLNDIISPEEREQMFSFMGEARQKADEILLLFGKDTRSMMLFMVAMQVLQRKHPSLINGKATERVAEWFAAGAPEDIKDVPDRIIARAMKEANGNQRPN